MKKVIIISVWAAGVVAVWRLCQAAAAERRFGPRFEPLSHQGET